MENKTPNTLNITADDEEQQLFMSYGLLTRLTRVMSNADEAINGTLSADMRDQLIKECLIEKGKSGIDGFTSESDLEDLDMSLEDFEKIMDWAVAHVLAFFMRRMESAGEMMENLAPQVAADQPDASEPSESGSKD